MLGLTSDRYVTNHGILWHDPQLQAEEPEVEFRIDEDLFIRRINALLRPHQKQRLPMYDKRYNHAMDQVVREIIDLGENDQ
jgi:hypothetical protein